LKVGVKVSLVAGLLLLRHVNRHHVPRIREHGEQRFLAGRVLKNGDEVAVFRACSAQKHGDCSVAREWVTSGMNSREQLLQSKAGLLVRPWG